MRPFKLRAQAISKKDYDKKHTLAVKIPFRLYAKAVEKCENEETTFTEVIRTHLQRWVNRK